VGFEVIAALGIAGHFFFFLQLQGKVPPFVLEFTELSAETLALPDAVTAPA
jgi:hypothetical protein